MEPSVLHSQIGLFSEQDDCLYFALGLARVTEKMIRLASDQTWFIRDRVPEPTTFLDNPQVILRPDDDNLLDFILGLISFSMRLQQTVDIFDVRLNLSTILIGSGIETADQQPSLPNLLF